MQGVSSGGAPSFLSVKAQEAKASLNSQLLSVAFGRCDSFMLISIRYRYNPMMYLGGATEGFF